MSTTPDLHVSSINVDATSLPEALAEGVIQWAIARGIICTVRN